MDTCSIKEQFKKRLLIRVEVTGINEIVNKFRRLPQTIPDTTHRVLSAGANDIISDARTDVHRVSGQLANSGRVSSARKNDITGGFYTSYAAREEFRQGGRKASHEYLRPAIARHIPGIRQRMIAELMRLFI